MSRQVERLHEIMEEFVQLAKCYYRMEIQKGLQQMDKAGLNLHEFLELVQSERPLEEEALQEINQLLELLMNFLHNQDFVLAADLIQFELYPRLQRLVAL